MLTKQLRQPSKKISHINLAKQSTNQFNQKASNIKPIEMEVIKNHKILFKFFRN